MSLKDALNQGVGGHSLSEEDLQNVAAELLFQEEPNQIKTISLVADSDPAKLKKTPKQIKKSNVKIKSNPIDSITINTDNHVMLEEFPITFSTIECPSILEVQTQAECISTPIITEIPNNVKMLSFAQKPISVLTKEKPIGNKRSLILKNNIIKPVISVQKKISNEKETKYKTSKYGSMLIDPNSIIDKVHLVQENYVSCEDNSDNSEVMSALTDGSDCSKPAKKRGGWPKGRKRKPEIRSEIRPPKAPATGYVIFLNEKRKDYRDMPFTEVCYSVLKKHEVNLVC